MKTLRIVALAALVVATAALGGCNTTRAVVGHGTEAAGLAIVAAPAPAPVVAGAKTPGAAPKVAQVNLDCAANPEAEVSPGRVLRMDEQCGAGVDYTVHPSNGLAALPGNVVLGTSTEMGDYGGQCLVGKVVDGDAIRISLGAYRANGSPDRGLTRGMPRSPIVLFEAAPGGCGDLAANPTRFVVVPLEVGIAAFLANPVKKSGMFGTFQGPNFERFARR